MSLTPKEMDLLHEIKDGVSENLTQINNTKIDIGKIDERVKGLKEDVIRNRTEQRETQGTLFDKIGVVQIAGVQTTAQLNSHVTDDKRHTERRTNGNAKPNGKWSMKKTLATITGAATILGFLIWGIIGFVVWIFKEFS